MGLKDLTLLKDSGREQDLREIAVRGDVETYRGLPAHTRELLLNFLKRTGIAEHRVLLLEMMLRSQQPDILTLQRLDQIIGEVRHEVISQTMKAAQPKPKLSSPQKPELMLVNPHRVLPAAEMVRRFKKLGADFYGIVMDWEAFYSNHRFGKSVKKALGNEEYHLPFPKITHQAMEAFEKAHEEGRIDTFMIDDARIPDGKTLKLYDRKTLKRFKRKYGFTTMEEAARFIDLTGQPGQDVRMVGFSTKPKVFSGRQRAKCFQEFSPPGPYHDNIGLGTYLRIFHYLALKDPNALYAVKCFSADGSSVLHDRTVLLNNKTGRNEILTLGPDPADPRLLNSLEIGPEITEPCDRYEAPMTIVASDRPPRNRKFFDREMLGHMDTWPAPENPDYVVGADGLIEETKTNGGGEGF